MITSLIIAGIIISSLAIIFLGYFLMRNSLKLREATEKFYATQGQLTDELKKQENLQVELNDFKAKLADTLLSDPLTGLPSRKIYEDRLNLTLNQSARYQLTFAVMFMDLDGFKIINDALGHDVGDELLQAVANRMLLSIRQVDTMSRFAGDEFAFLLPQLNKPETAAYIAQRFLDVISQPFKIRGENLYITASVGIALYPNDANDGQTLIKYATNALHQAKSRGRNMYQFYRSEMHAMSRRELILNSNLRDNSVYQDFLLYFQPLVNVKTKKIVCMEASLRWQHNDFGFIQKEEFTRLAERSGKMIAIGEWTMRHACQHFITWQSDNFFPNSISVLVSLKQIENPHFVQKISNILQETKVDPANLILSISESSLVTQIEVVEKMLHMLKHLGVRIAISHFGTGHLSLQYLRRLPIDLLKIDAGLVRDVTVSKESEAIIKMIIVLANTLNLEVVAEGVETLKQKQLLEEFGCNVMQGALFGNFALPREFNSTSVEKMLEMF